MLILKQTFINHIIHQKFTATINVLIVGGWWILEDKNFESLAFSIGLYNLLFTFPSVYLHFEYTFHNLGEEIEINDKEIIIRKRGKERRYRKFDLVKIIVYKSASLDKGGIPLSAMESYYYVELITASGEHIVITSLMSPKVDIDIRNIREVPWERKKGFFCSINMRK